MPTRSKWSNEDMWREVVRLKKGGLSYQKICARLSNPQTMKQFGIEEVPSEDTDRKQTRRRLSAESEADISGISKATAVPEDPTLAQQSGHLDGLRNAAKTLEAQVRAPLIQLVRLVNSD